MTNGATDWSGATGDSGRTPAAGTVLRVLAGSDRPIDRRVLAEQVGGTDAAFRHGLATLEAAGTITVTNRFGVGLGPTLANPDALLPQHFSTTIGTLVRDRLAPLAAATNGLAFLVSVPVGPAGVHDVRVHETTAPLSRDTDDAIRRSVLGAPATIGTDGVSRWTIHGRGHRLVVGAVGPSGALLDHAVREYGLRLTRELRRPFPSGAGGGVAGGHPAGVRRAGALHAGVLPAGVRPASVPTASTSSA
ncbi:hypothetical protein [Curtobacterium sp. ISL-83]|uniref:hypothetical protein n=1 Tax=Curtobacterium sp. ISL-83 TaxID=2819145 RepID=UPI001BEBEE36|nr:hypothetical protein [Curtobacterium sp. ISL-83]MBT2502409.1 hypothetical protein [Curtobacterium sp. ISL-83]